MNLGQKYAAFRHRLPLNMPREQMKLVQFAYIAGAQAAYQILAEASGKTAEEAVAIWGDLQKEMLDAVQAKKPLVVVPKPNVTLQ